MANAREETGHEKKHDQKDYKNDGKPPVRVGGCPERDSLLRAGAAGAGGGRSGGVHRKRNWRFK